MALAYDPPKTVGEAFELLKKAKSKTERLKILKENDSLALRSILRLNYDPNLKFELPEGTPPYTPNPKPVGFGDTTLKTAIDGFYVFVKASCPGLRQHKREMMFINLLETLDSQEAKLLIDAKDKKLKLGLTTKTINEVFPGLLPEEPKKEKSDESDVESAEAEESKDESQN